jgi:bifunctional DNA-binding transcriptional regulator/antitoxin component of YhaV-PrlF toxin-antitoxin module
MTKLVSINDGGALTLPAEMRRRLFVSGATQVVAEETAEGVLLRPIVDQGVELYSEERLAEFQKHNETELARIKHKPQP